MGRERLTLHDVVTVCDETDADGQSHHSDLPKRNFLLGLRSGASAPGSVHASPDTNSVTNIVRTMGKRRGTCSDNLYE